MIVSPSVLIVTTQTWLQITRLTMRLAGYGCRIAVICPEESHLTHAPGVATRYRFELRHPLDSLCAAIRASKADYLVPADDSAVWFLHEIAEMRPELRSLIERSIGDSGSFARIRSRFEVLSLAHELEIAVPHTQVMTAARDLKPWLATGAPAFVLKKDGTWGGGGVQIVQGEEAGEAFERLSAGIGFGSRVTQWLRNGDSSAFARLRCARRPEITAQAFVPGVPANAMYACHEGRILGEVQAKVVVSTGETGPSIVIRLIEDARISRAGRLLAEALRLSGFFGLDFILDARSGEPLLIEMNPRSTRLGHIAVSGRPDLAACLWSQWTGQDATVLGEPSLPSEIGFYPEGQRWLNTGEAQENCRCDVLAGEEEVIDSLLHAPAKGHKPLRKRIWSSLSGLKHVFREETTPQPFHHREPETREGKSMGGTALPPTLQTAWHWN
jgi:hypothetical protein